VSLSSWKNSKVCFKRGGTAANPSRPVPPCSSGYHACGTGTYDANRAVCEPDAETETPWPTSSSSTGCPLTLLTSDDSMAAAWPSASLSGLSFGANQLSKTFFGQTYTGTNVYAAAGSDVVSMQLPIVDLTVAFIQNAPEGPCFGIKAQDETMYNGPSSLSGLNNYPSSCRETDKRWVQYDQVSESDLEPLPIATLLRLDCSTTQVSKLEPLRNFASLQILDYSSTKVSDLKPIVDLQYLHTLYIRNLQISEFPRKLLFSEKLHTLDLTGANIPGIPEEALSSDEKVFYNCLPALRAHVLDLEVEAIPINSVKILVLGNGGVGKTQLCRHLAAEHFDPTVLTTHGIALRTIAPASEGDATKYLWDFGGQDIYHSAHTLFMRTAAVFVVLWTPEQEALVASDNDNGDFLERLHPLTYWLDYVRTLGRNNSYPTNNTAVDALFGAAATHVTLSYTPSHAADMLAAGAWPAAINPQVMTC
jgi:hypothetical protein